MHLRDQHLLTSLLIAILFPIIATTQVESTEPDPFTEVFVHSIEFGDVSYLKYSPDGAYLISSNEGDIVFSDVRTGRVMRKISTDMIDPKGI